MTITKRQKKRIEEQALKNLLNRGELPFTEAVEREIAKLSEGKTFGRPLLEFQPVRPNELSDPVAFNRLVHSVQGDLEVAFDEAVTHGNNVSRSMTLYETERKIAEQNLKKLEQRIKRLLDAAQNPFTHNVLSEDFRSFSQLSFKADALRGIPKTTAHIALEAGEARLPSMEAGTVKYDLSKATVLVEAIGGTGQEITPFAEAFRDTLSGAWQYRVTRPDVGLTSVQVTIGLTEAVDASRLSVHGRMPKEPNVQLELSLDGSSWTVVSAGALREQLEWQFDQSVKHIRLTLTKETPDFFEGTEMQYYFSLLNISLKSERYVKEAHIVSTPLSDTNEILDRVVFEADDVIYPGTAIQYYIGAEADSFIEWQEIRPGVPMEFNQLVHREELLTLQATGYGALHTENFGVSYYGIGALGRTPVPGRVKVFVGDYMWKVETRDLGTGTATATPTLAEWRETGGADIAYLGVEETVQGKEWETQANSLQRFSLDIHLPKNEEVFNAELVHGGAGVRVYLNNEPLKGSATGRYTYRFKAGWNRIEILVHSVDAQPFAPNLYLRDITSHVLASKEPLTEVTVYDLTHNVPKRDESKFAWTDDGPVVNYDPVTKDAQGSGVRFLTTYASAAEGALLSGGIRVMAKLSREDGSSHMTPVVRAYKIRLE